MGKFTRNGLLVTIALVAIACSGGGSELGGAAATVQTFYDHLDAGRYDEAIALYDATTKQQLLPDEDAKDGFREWAEIETHDGSLADINVLNETAGDGTMTIEFELTFDDGESARRTVTLTEEDGAWFMGVIG